MGVKYTIPIIDDFNTHWRAEIDIPDFVGDPTALRGVGRGAIVPEWSVIDTDEPYSAIVSSKVALSFYNTDEASVDVEEIQLLGAREARMNLYKEELLWWSGYIEPDGIQRYFKAKPYSVSITAVDGLAILSDTPFMGMNNFPMQAGVANRSPLAYIREVLYRTAHLGIPLPIRWASEVECTYFPGEDGLAGSITWGSSGEPYTDFNGNRRSCMYVLEGMLKAFQCRLFQFGGKWHVMRINDIVEGTYDWKEITTDFGTAPTETSGSEDLLADYRVVNENQIIIIKPALTDMYVRYDHSIPENILPNGDFESWQLSFILLHWGYSRNPNLSANIIQSPSLNGRGSYSVTLSYPSSGAGQEDAIFELIGDSIVDTGLPIDAHILFKRMTFGFTICPKFGFPYDEDGYIDWSSAPLRYIVMYVADGKAFYLNEYGYWQYYPPEGYLRISSYSEVESGSDRIFTYVFTGYPLENDIIELKWFSPGPPVPSSPSAFVNVTSANVGNLEAVLQELQGEIPPLWSSTLTMISPGFWELTVTAQIVFNDAGHTVGSGANTLDPTRTIALTVDGAKINDVISVQFQGRGGNTDIIIPDPGVLDGTQLLNTGKMYIQFMLKDGQEYILDNVWVNVDSNNDVYHSYISGQDRTSKKEENMEISSSFSGSAVSNFMTVFSKSNDQFIFTDGVYTGSLTGMTANAIMRFRNKASIIFEGDIYTDGRDWMFHHIYNITGLIGVNLLPLSSKYNIETGEVSITAIEGRSDEDLILLEQHYGSNDKQLSTANFS